MSPQVPGTMAFKCFLGHLETVGFIYDTSRQWTPICHLRHLVRENPRYQLTHLGTVDSMWHLKHLRTLDSTHHLRNPGREASNSHLRHLTVDSRCHHRLLGTVNSMCQLRHLEPVNSGVTCGSLDNRLTPHHFRHLATGTSDVTSASWGQ